MDEGNPHKALTEAERQVLLDTWKLLEENIARVGVITFLRLFETHPDVQGFFPSLSGMTMDDLRHSKQLQTHALKVMGFVQKVVARLQEPAKLQALVRQLGRSHVHYGAKQAYIDVTSFGTICVFLQHQIRVDISLDQAMRVVNPVANCVAAIDARGSISCLIHPSGCVYQNGSQVDVRTARDQMAKMSHRGIAFTTVGSPVVYLLDDGGARTTVASFADLSVEHDFSLEVFYDNSRHGQDSVSECLEAVLSADITQRRDNTWHINGIDVTQVASTGDVYVSRDQGRRQMKTSPVRGNVSVTTPYAHACASSPPEAHVFVRRGERRIHASEQCFNARNGSHSAGFDDAGKFKFVGPQFIYAIKPALEGQWSTEVESAWLNLFAYVTGVMKAAMTEVQQGKVSSSGTAMGATGSSTTDARPPNANDDDTSV